MFWNGSKWFTTGLSFAVSAVAFFTIFGRILQFDENLQTQGRFSGRKLHLYIKVMTLDV